MLPRATANAFVTGRLLPSPAVRGHSDLCFPLPLEKPLPDHTCVDCCLCM